jgi:hypothetical protein
VSSIRVTRQPRAEPAMLADRPAPRLVQGTRLISGAAGQTHESHVGLTEARAHSRSITASTADLQQPAQLADRSMRRRRPVRGAIPRRS